MIPNKNPIKRWRLWAMLALPVVVILFNSFGPDGWREPVVKMLWLSWTALCVALAHSARKALFDYAHGREAWLKAMEHPIGAGLAFLGLCLVSAVLVLAFVGFARAQPVPANAQLLAPLVVQEINSHWPQTPRRSYIGALIEKESCVTLKSRACWTTTARLKTSREEGAGLGQLTRAWNSRGGLRFDALAEVRDMDVAALQELSWDTIYLRADLGVRAVLVKLRDCHNRFERLKVPGEMARLAFCDAAYNGGLAGVQQDRKLCALTKGCNPDLWFGHVEHHSGKSRAKWQGYGASAFDINRAHVKATVPLEPRRWRYAQWLGV